MRVFTPCSFDILVESMPFISSVTESVHTDLQEVMKTKREVITKLNVAHLSQ